MNKKLPKYLQSRGVNGPWQLANGKPVLYDAAIVIPALAESESLPDTIASIAANPAGFLRRTLVLVVVNNRVSSLKEDKNDNRATLDWLISEPFPQLNLAWIDACSPGLELPEGEGVGMARKIGFDLALSCLDWGGSPLLISLDADTLVDAHYLPAIFSHFANSSSSGATIPFRHQTGCSPAAEQAIRRYELYLRSYRFGLQQAGSPYAYHAIGSALACHAEAYLTAGGMNRRLAGEDFYFLQQLSKTSGVGKVGGTLVAPSARSSGRVPFGTGPVISRHLQGRRGGFRFVPTAGFSLLKRWLSVVAENWQVQGAELEQMGEEISPILRDFLRQQRFPDQWDRFSSQHRGKGQRLRAFHGWFDGLRTRQLLGHWAQDLSQEAELSLARDLLQWGGIREVGTRLEDLLEIFERLELGPEGTVPSGPAKII